MPPPEIDRRPRIAVMTVVCIAAVFISAMIGDWNTATTAAFFRVSIVMFALWLAYPTFHRRTVWQRSSKRIIMIAVLAAVFINRLRFILPAVAVVLIVLWFVRPKKRSRQL